MIAIPRVELEEHPLYRWEAGLYRPLWRRLFRDHPTAWIFAGIYLLYTVAVMAGLVRPRIGVFWAALGLVTLVNGVQQNLWMGQRFRLLRDSGLLRDLHLSGQKCVATLLAFIHARNPLRIGPSVLLVLFCSLAQCYPAAFIDPGAVGGFIGAMIVPVAGFLWDAIPKRQIRLKYELTIWFFLEKEVPYKTYQAFLWAFLTIFVTLAWLQWLSGCALFVLFCCMLVAALGNLSRLMHVASLTEAQWERQYLEFLGIDPPTTPPEG